MKGMKGISEKSSLLSPPPLYNFFKDKEDLEKYIPSIPFVPVEKNN